MVLPRQAPNEKGVQDRRSWLTALRLHAALSANCSRNCIRQVHEPSAVGVSRNFKENLENPNFLFTFARMRIVTQFILDYVNHFQMVSIVEIVLTIRCERYKKDARARVFHACVRSNHYQPSQPCAQVCAD